MQRSTALLLIALTALLGAAFAGARTIDANASVYEGVTRPAHTYRLAAPVDEIVGEVLVEPGDVVETGQTLVRLRDAEARLAVELLELRAGSTLGADAAKAAWEVSALEAEASREAMDAGAVLEPEMRRVALRAQRDRLIFEQTLQERDELAIQLRRARATLERYTLTAPAPGVVVSVRVEPGERAERATPLVEVVDTRSLRIDVGVRASEAMRLSRDGAVEVALDLPDTPDATLRGHILAVSPIVDIAAGASDETGRRAVIVEADNPRGFPAGTRAEVRFLDRD